MTKAEVIGKLADIMCGWSRAEFAMLPASQFCADMLELFPGKAPVLTDEECEALTGMSDSDIHAAVLAELKR